MLSENMIQRISNIIETHTYMEKEEQANYYYDDIYVDYRDSLDDKTIKKAFEHKNPKEFLQDYLYECFLESEFEYQDELCATVMKHLEDEISEDSLKPIQDDVKEWLQEYCYFNVPLDHYFNQDVCVDIIVDTGDGNYDFTLNCVYPHYNGEARDIMDDHASLLWLTKQQGYTKTALNKARWDSEYNNSKFLKSVDAEIHNCSTHMNALSFFVTMSLGELCDLNAKVQELQGQPQFVENKYTPYKIKMNESITLDKSTTCGLYDTWNGAGSILEIELEKDVKLPIKYIDSIAPDGYRGYGVDDIYGMCRSFWTDNAIKEISY